MASLVARIVTKRHDDVNTIKKTHNPIHFAALLVEEHHQASAN